MSKARPHAHIYEKWVRGIKKTVPKFEDRCRLYEYIFQYQFAKIYDMEMPDAGDMTLAGLHAYFMIEGDLNELCEARKENNERRKQNGKRKCIITGTIEEQ